jgi:hypothetical protein
MAWTHTYEARPENWSAEVKLAWARGSHDGYARSRDGVIHRRAVWLRDDGYVVVFDEILGTGAHVVQANYQFAPGSLVPDGHSKALFNERYECAWVCSVGTSASIKCGKPEPTGGWVANSLGVREPAPRLVLDFSFTEPRVALLTVVADRARAVGNAPRVQKILSEASVLSASVSGIAGDDWLIASTGERLAWGGVETDAALGVVRRQDGRVTETQALGGTYLRVLAGGDTDSRIGSVVEASQ